MSLLHRVILSHDEKTADGILNFSDENGLMRDRASSSALVKITQKMSYPETCTVDFTGFVGLNQYMYECEECSTRVCLVCMHTCHGKDTKCRSQYSTYELEKEPLRGWKFCGLVNDYCHCPRETCRALASTDNVEKEGYAYVRPIDTSSVVLSEELKRYHRSLLETSMIFGQQASLREWLAIRQRA